MISLYQRKALLCKVLTMAMACFTEGKNLTAFQGDNKVLQWTMNPIPPPDTVVTVLYPLMLHSDWEYSYHGYSTLYSILGTAIAKSDNSQAHRVTNTSNSNGNTGHIEFTLNDIREDDGGDYRSEYHATGLSRIMNVGIRLVVYVKPSKPTIAAVSPPVVGIVMTVNCATQSNSKPDDHGLQMKYKWYRNGVALSTGDRYVTSGSQLQVKNIQRSDNNTMFTCEAFETDSLLSDASAEYTVDVQYGPDHVTLSPPSLVYTLRELNENLPAITCISSCNPACSFSWERNGNHVSNGQTLSKIINITRGQAGQYVCNVANIHGESKANVTVTVQYSPDKPVISINGANADLSESSPITFKCTTQSVPPAMLIISGSNLTALNIKDNTLTSTFTIPRVNCLDTGLFFCSAVNNIGNSTSDGFKVNVLCKPRPDHRITQVLKQGLDSGETIHISGSLISNPPPTIYWSMRHNGSSVFDNLTNNKDNFKFDNYWTIPTITYHATRTSIKVEDFGEYMMHAVNEYGTSVIVYTISKRRNPDGPELLSVLCKFETSVQIKFKPNFDGGDTQRFSIEIKSESNAVFKMVGEKIPDNNNNEMTLEGPILEPGVLYVFRITATNSYGTASSINQLNCTIEEPTIERTGGDMYLSGTVMLVIGLLALSATIMFGIVFHLRRKRTVQKSPCPKCGFLKTDKIKGSTVTNFESQHYQDIGHTTAENGQSIEVAENHNVVYEGLGPQPPPTVYEKLNYGSHKPEQTEAQYANTTLN